MLLLHRWHVWWQVGYDTRHAVAPVATRFSLPLPTPAWPRPYLPYKAMPTRTFFYRWLVPFRSWSPTYLLPVAVCRLRGTTLFCRLSACPPTRYGAPFSTTTCLCLPLLLQPTRGILVYVVARILPGSPRFAATPHDAYSCLR